MNNIFKKTISRNFIILVFVAWISGISIGCVIYYTKVSPKSTVTVITTSTSTTKPMPVMVEEYLNKGQFPEGIEYINNYLQTNPDDPQTYKYYGILLTSNGNYKDSIKQLQIALEKNTANQLSDSDLVQIYYFLGRNYHSLHQNDLAITNFQKSLEIDPNCYQCYDGLGLIAKQNKDYKSAINFFEQELKLISDAENNPLAAYLYYNLAQIYFKNGNYTLAQEMIQKADSLSKLLLNPIPTVFLQEISTLKKDISTKLHEE